MIYSLNGIIRKMEQNLVVLDVGGVGFAVKTSMTTISRLPGVGKQALLYTYLHVREDALELCGFSEEAELNCYKMLISVNGVGAKAALSILSDQTPERFALTVAAGDAKLLTKSPGIGMKTAQRIVLELKDKMAKEQVAAGITGESPSIVSNAVSGNASEAISALTVLGYARADAARVVAAMDPALSVEEMIKQGLRQLAKAL